MNILVCCVNYRTDEALGRFLQSIRQSAATAPDEVAVSVHVIDNSLRPETEHAAFVERVRDHLPGCNVSFPSGNLGYFGALPIAQQLLAGSPASIVIFSNADITLAADFFSELARATHSANGAAGNPDMAAIAPAIIADHGHGFDQNPKHVARVPRSKLRLLSLVYSNSFTFFLQQFAGYLKELSRGRPALRGEPLGTAIYAPHGALFIFTDPDFFAGLPAFEPFLFGEELFVAEEALRAGKRIVYLPSIQVFDSRHASTANLGSGRRRRLMKESVDYILKRYR